MDMSEKINMFLEIIKFKITILVSFTTGLGFILASDKITLEIFYPVIGIFLLACSASALNHYQERETDSLMKRTSSRPIPSGKIEPVSVLIISGILLITGTAVLSFGTNLLTLGVGYLTFLWYNGIYTPLKRKTAWAIIPGSLVGALPPIAGWTAAGGNIFSAEIIIVALYFFIWQIPHFWLLLMLYSEDYEKGGFPTLSQIFSVQQLKRITFMWLITTVIIALIFPLFGLVNFAATNIFLLLISAFMIYNSVLFYKSDAGRKRIISSFVSINFYTLLLITILSIDKFVKLI
jgi:protoheme IX farnesyltransferase